MHWEPLHKLTIYLYEVKHTVAGMTELCMVLYAYNTIHNSVMPAYSQHIKMLFMSLPAETLLAPSPMSSSACLLLPTLQKTVTYKGILGYTNTRPCMYVRTYTHTNNSTNVLMYTYTWMT